MSKQDDITIARAAIRHAYGEDYLRAADEVMSNMLDTIQELTLKEKLNKRKLFHTVLISIQAISLISDRESKPASPDSPLYN
jgi:hypothetical protein